MIYIFLDLDGVLIREGYFIPYVYDILDKNCLDLFEYTLRKFTNHYKIVITSSWKEIFTLDFIKSKFSGDIAKEIIAVTPFLFCYTNAKYYRHQEVLQYLKNNSLEEAPWIAIDDTKEHYPTSCEAKMVYPEPNVGFCGADAERLSLLLEQYLKV